MKYRSEFPDSYKEGIRNKSFTISAVAEELLQESEIDNASALINDLIIEALQEKDMFKKRVMGGINRALKEMKEKYNEEFYLVKKDNQSQLINENNDERIMGC